MHDGIPKARGAKSSSGGRPFYDNGQDILNDARRMLDEANRMAAQYNIPQYNPPRPRRRTDYRYLVVLFAGFMAWIFMVREGFSDAGFGAGFATVVSLFGIWLSSRVNWR